VLNLILAFFNLIPIYPLDGSHILVSLLPLEQARKVEMFYHRFGMIALIVLIVSPATDYLVGHPVALLYGLLATPL